MIERQENALRWQDVERGLAAGQRLRAETFSKAPGAFVRAVRAVFRAPGLR
ncbi:MAG: hypothetical protein ACFB6S_02320 [Geminicoccaceae bacterium]